MLTVFLAYVFQQLSTANRVDIVWDEYILHSLKNVTRQKRGKGIRRRVTSTIQLPKNWRDFLHMNENKAELFNFLSQQIASSITDEGKVIYAANGVNVLSTSDADVTNLSPSCKRCCAERMQKIVDTNSRYRCFNPGNCYG